MVDFNEPDPLDPEGSYTQAFPDYFKRGAQVRQYGVGGAATKAPPVSVVGSLYEPPEAMVTAAEAVRTATVITESDQDRYFAAP